MSILSEIITALESSDIPIETGVFSGTPPSEYLVITPMVDSFLVFADNLPQLESSEARISLFSKCNYLAMKNEITDLLIDAGFTITDRRYIGHEDDTKFHHYVIDVAKEFNT